MNKYLAKMLVIYQPNASPQTNQIFSEKALYKKKYDIKNFHILLLQNLSAAYYEEE